MKAKTSNVEHQTSNIERRNFRRPDIRGLSAAGRPSLFLFALGISCFAAASAPAASANSLLTKWLAAQTNIQAWSADFVQTRTLKSLAQPLTASGHVWFAAPNQFRWELGHPPETIAVRSGDVLRVIYPRLKRAEIYPLKEAGQWRAALSLLEAGFPRSRAQLESQYNVVSQTPADGRCEVTLQPKAASARQMIPRIKIGFSTENFSLVSTELEFADGSTMRNDFKNAELNPKADETMFNPKIGSDFKIIEPLKQNK